MRSSSGSDRPGEAAHAVVAPPAPGVAGCRWLGSLVGRAVRQPLSTPVPADDAAYLRRKGCTRLAFRIAKRRLQLALSGQDRLLRDALDPAWTRLLWIHLEAPQLGDLLMDLAPRSLLAERGLRVDVVTTPLLASLLQGDRWLRRARSANERIDASDYDAVITSSHAPRALAWKRRHVPSLPWVALAGDYTVPDYQRAQFDTVRLADLLGVRLTSEDRRVHARQKLDVAPPTPAPWPDDRRSVAIAVGGVWAGRSYAHWPTVVGLLQAAGVRRVRLVGSDNGRAAADAVLAAAAAAGELQVDDGVGRLGLHATRAALAASGVALCADGGLLHLALTTPVRVVALFNRDVEPGWRLPDDLDGVVLQSTTSGVSDVAPERIADAAMNLLPLR